MRLRGLKWEEVASELGHNSPQAAIKAFLRGEKYVLDHGINIPAVKVHINELFADTLSALAADVRYQALYGQVTEELDHKGNVVSARRVRGVNPRTAAELSRSLKCWAEFSGLVDASRSQSDKDGGAVTMIQLNMPSDGAQFGQRWIDAGEAQPLPELADAIPASLQPAPGEALVAALSPAEPAGLPTATASPSGPQQDPQGHLQEPAAAEQVVDIPACPAAPQEAASAPAAAIQPPIHPGQPQEPPAAPQAPAWASTRWPTAGPLVGH